MHTDAIEPNRFRLDKEKRMTFVIDHRPGIEMWYG